MSEFECRRCGDCCRWGGYTYLTKEDIKRIAAHFSLGESEFVNKYTDMAQRPRLNLRMKENGECIFLDKDNCTIQSVKPYQCSTFPVLWRIKNLESF